MFSWFLGLPAKKVVLILKPDESGKQYAGFYSGEPLELIGTEGETIGAVMDKFNTYRGPEQQILRLFTETGQPISFQTPVTNGMTAIIKR